jgi:ABC-type nitrate/sulfonate/bicarbonate transport system ATPase subunit
MLRIDQVSRTFPARQGNAPTRALEPTTLDVGNNDFVTILGPSGCGKSTLLRIIAGLDRPTSGRVILDGQEVTAPGADRGMVFQSNTLFPWLTVRDNIAFGLRERGVSEAERGKIADGFIKRVGLTGFENHWPKQLSGGMQQRTAIARAFIHDPKLILMDEPFGALDALTREQMNLEMLRIWRESGKTIIFVTHSIQEAVFLASHCAVLTAGPARMAEYFPIELPFPRDLPIKTTDEFGAYARRIYASLGLSAG